MKIGFVIAGVTLASIASLFWLAFLLHLQPDGSASELAKIEFRLAAIQHLITAGLLSFFAGSALVLSSFFDNVRATK